MAKRKKATARKTTTVRRRRSRPKRAPIALGELFPGAAPAEPAETGPVPESAFPGGGSPLLEALVHESLASFEDPPAPLPAPARPNAMPDQARLYERLAALLVPYAREMETEMHPRIGHCLKARSRKTKHEVHFGAVQVLPDGVAFHLFPLYAHPELLAGMSPELFTRMRGQTCFHLEQISEESLAELAELTRRGFECFLTDGMA